MGQRPPSRVSIAFCPEMAGASRRLEGVTMDLRGELATVAAWHAGQSPVIAQAPR